MIPSYNNIPRGPLSMIGDYLDPESLARASEVSRKWKQVFGQHPLWKKFCAPYTSYCLGNRNWRVLYFKHLRAVHRIGGGKYNITFPDHLNFKLKSNPLFPGICYNPHLKRPIDDYVNVISVQAFKGYLVLAMNGSDPLVFDPSLKANKKVSKEGFVANDSISDLLNGDHIRFFRRQGEMLYGCSNNRIYCWCEEDFPRGGKMCDQLDGKILDLRTSEEGILYCLYWNDGTIQLSARRGQDTIWSCNNIFLQKDFLLNESIGVLKDYGCLYIWDPNEDFEPVKIAKRIVRCALAGNVVICVNYDGSIDAYSSGGDVHRIAAEDTFFSVAAEYPIFCDGANIYAISITDLSEYKVFTYSIENKGIINELTIGEPSSYVSLDRNPVFTNGLLYFINEGPGSLVIVDPLKGAVHFSKKRTGIVSIASGTLCDGIIAGVFGCWVATKFRHGFTHRRLMLITPKVK